MIKVFKFIDYVELRGVEYMPAKSGNSNARKNKSANREMWSGRLDKEVLEIIQRLSSEWGLKSQGEVIDRAVRLLENRLNVEVELNEVHEG